MTFFGQRFAYNKLNLEKLSIVELSLDKQRGLDKLILEKLELSLYELS